MIRYGFYRRSQNPFGLFIGLAIFAGLVYGIFKLTQWVFSMLYAVAPVVLIAALIIDARVYKELWQSVVQLYRRSIGLGIAVSILGLAFYPLVATYLLIKALLRRQPEARKEEIRRMKEGELVDFEELESEPLEKRAQPRDKDLV
jgi:hypothetical protein